MSHKVTIKSITLALLLMSTAAWAEAPVGTFADKRIAINVSQAEKNQVLYEMREFLHGLHNLNLALARQDMNAFATTAKPMGPLLNRLPANLKTHLPEEFTQLSIAMDEAFQNLARGAENKVEMRQMHENMAEVMTYCSGCHDTYRFNVMQAKATKARK
jgi:cytochrome c556